MNCLALMIAHYMICAGCAGWQLLQGGAVSPHSLVRWWFSLTAGFGPRCRWVPA